MMRSLSKTKNLYYPFVLPFLIACAPTGTENDTIEYQSRRTDATIKTGTEKNYIDQAFKASSLDQDSTGDYPKAILYLDSALQINPKSSKACRLKASILLIQVDASQALAMVNSAIQSDSGDYHSYVIRVNIYLKLKQRRKALVDYYTALKIDSTDGRIWESAG